MEDTVKNIEMIDQFIANERKSRLSVVISVVLFCLLGALVFLLAYRLNKSNARFKVLSDKYEKLADENIQLKNDCLRENVTLTSQIGNWEGELDSLQKVCDTVTLLFKTQSENPNDFESDPESKIDRLGQLTFNGREISLSKNLKTMLINPGRWNITEKQVYTVQLKCMEKYKEAALVAWEQLREGQLNGKKFAVEPVQFIPSDQDISFNPVVKYFNSSDSVLAGTLAGKLNNSGIKFFNNNPVNIQRQMIKAPPGQVEIWIGKYEKPDLNQLILKSPRYRPNRLQ